MNFFFLLLDETESLCYVIWFFFSQVATVFSIGIIVSVCHSAKISFKSAPDPNDRFFDDENFLFSKDVKDNKAPTVYTGDVMKARLTEQLNISKKDRFHAA